MIRFVKNLEIAIMLIAAWGFCTDNVAGAAGAARSSWACTPRCSAR